jgi:hypothetical protein
MSNEARATDSAGVKERLREEMRRYLMVSAYLFVCFTAVLLYKSAILREAGQHFLPFGLAAGKALILGKFILIGEAAGVGTRVGARNLLQRIGRRSLLFLLLLVVLTLAEEIIVGLVHGRSVGQVLGEFAGASLPEHLASVLVVLLILVPLVTVTEASRALGPGALSRLMLGSPGPGADGSDGDAGTR